MTYSTAELEKIRSAVKRPADFDAFWAGVIDDLAQTPVEWERESCLGAQRKGRTITHSGKESCLGAQRKGWTLAPSGKDSEPALSAPGYTVDVIRFLTLGDEARYAWLAIPDGEGAQQSTNGFLWLPGYSLGNPPPGAESLYPGTTTMGLNLHGNLPDTPYVHPSKTGDDYITDGIESPQTYIYRKIVATCLRALDVLAQQPEVDPSRLIVGGMSQGGALALIVSALRRDVRMCWADMPWMCDIDLALSLVDLTKYRRIHAGASGRVPDGRMLVAFYAEDHPAVADQVFRTYRTFDPLSHADRIACPVQISAGARDPSCRPPTVYSVYNHLCAEKEMLYLPSAGHEIVPQMRQSHLKWLQSKLQ